jgi:hypothetical protein
VDAQTSTTTIAGVRAGRIGIVFTVAAVIVALSRV